jgi:hypothetical protein
MWQHAVNSISLINKILALQLEKMAQSVDVLEPTKSKQASEWDSITLDQFMKKCLWTQGI